MGFQDGTNWMDDGPVAKPVIPLGATDDEVCALLERYRCPVPFHAVRTRLLGAIASPAMQGAPMDTVAELWGGKLPPVESLDAANELIAAIITGLWNRRARLRERSVPFRLTRLEAAATREGLARLALRRREGLDGFAEGLFGNCESLDLPERAHQAFGVMAQMRSMLEGMHELAENLAKPAEPADIAETLGHLRELTRIAEREMHAAVLSCARAQRQMMRMLPAASPTRH
jgi:hypothetical protein